MLSTKQFTRQGDSEVGRNSVALKPHEREKEEIINVGEGRKRGKEIEISLNVIQNSLNEQLLCVFHSSMFPGRK